MGEKEVTDKKENREKRGGIFEHLGLELRERTVNKGERGRKGDSGTERL